MTLTDPFPAAAAAIGAIRATSSIVAFAPGEAGYDQARSGYGLTNLPSPDLVALPADADQVRTLVQVAREHALPIAVHGTGHNFAFPYRGGMLINTSKLRSVTFDDAAGTVTVGAGARWKDVLPGAQARGRAPLSGSSPEVGVLGYTLHGGVGWLARAYGAAVDSVRSAWVVTADGRLREASATKHPDLFWALRGAGGNFGVVVALELALVPVATVYGGARLYPLERAREVLTVYRRWVDGVPDAMTSSVTLLQLPPLASLPEVLRGRKVVALRACYAGDEADAVAVMEPLGVLGSPIVDTFRTMPYADAGEISADPTEPSAAWRHTAELADLDERAIDVLLELAGPGADSPLTVVEVRHLGGALARTAEGASSPHAFGRRFAPFVLQTIALRDGPHGAARVEAATAELAQAMRPFGAGSVLPGWLGDGDTGPERVRAGYDGDAWGRLVELKRRWDPENLFRLNHNIVTDTAATTPAVLA